MSKKRLIHFSLDWKCLSENKVKNGRLGGTERFHLMLISFLKSLGHEVSWIREDNRGFDLTIFSNSYDPKVKTKKSILFLGSWHGQPSDIFDEVVFVSNFTKEHYKWEKGKVIYACLEPQIFQYKTNKYRPRRIVTVANPNRYIEHAVEICKYLESKNCEVEWCVTGGNKLYSDQFPEPFSNQPSHSYIKYQGVLDRADLLKLLASAHISVYPNFTNDSETMGVSPLEAVALGVPVVLPAREPFFETMGASAYFVHNVKEAGDSIIEFVKHSCEREKYFLPIDLTPYSYDYVMNQWKEVIEEITRDLYD